MRDLSFILALTLFLSGSLHAGISGKVVGKVIDTESGQPLPGANLFLKGTSLGAAANFDGNYIILNVPPGTYTLTARMIGYKTVDYENVKISIDLTTTINFDMITEAIEAGEVVTVVAKTPLVRMDLTSSSVSVSAEQIESLPVDNFSDVVALQAGVVDGHFRGGRGNEVLYLVDGIPVNDVYSGDFAFQVENNAIQEMEIISGTFNAEYGQVQSGVVNVLTKEGGQHYSAQFSSYIGDYLSSHDEEFDNIDDLDPTAISDVKVNLSGPFPLLPNKLTFFASGRQHKNEGYIYGKTVYNPSVISGITEVIPESERIFKSLNGTERNSYQAKLTFIPNQKSKKNKFNIDGFWQNEESQNERGAEFDHLFTYSPDGMRQVDRSSWSAGLRWSHIVSNNTYFAVKLHHLQNKARTSVFEDPLDPRYSSDDRLRLRGNFSFYTGGTDMQHNRRETRTSLFKLDFTSQATPNHQIRGGVESKLHRLWIHEIKVRSNASTGFESKLPSGSGAFNQEYVHHPKEYAVYIQDKMEYENIIVNAGIRLDVFNPADSIIQDFSRPQKFDLTVGSTPNFGESADITYQVSPRIGLAYPITDRGVIHVSYGHFFQVPSFEFLYTNPNFALNTEGGRSAVFSSPFGGADLKPQKTVSYEIGLQQQVSEDIAIDVTGYYKDIRNLLGTKIETIATGETHSGTQYGRFINRDYGNVRGLIFSFEKRYSNNFSSTLDYTLQVASGNASDPRSVLIDNQADPPVQSEKQLVPLDWDRTHSLTLSVAVGPPKVYLISVIGKMGTGLPYTPSLFDQRTGLENSERRPVNITFDLNSHRRFKLKDLNLKVFFRVFNIFDRLNEREVYKDTGRATYTLEQNQVGLVQGLNTKDEFFSRPEWYSAPRQINIGFTIDIK